MIDQFTRECLKLKAAGRMSGSRVVECLERVAELRGYPESITVDNGPEFCSKAVDGWAYRKGVRLDFIRPGRPVENGFIESFNGRLRDSLAQRLGRIHHESSAPVQPEDAPVAELLDVDRQYREGGRRWSAEEDCSTPL